MKKASHNLLKKRSLGGFNLGCCRGTFQNTPYPLTKMNLKIKLKK
ncbi:hypothetical protein HPCPY1662_0333 [Helicobacter pylori CPY1662]|nr:hypothetical protein HPCPY1662_0333 [Helicobacter pylori CPY1662]EPZ96325.1 hypothetical protein N205_05705 [Helicobacter pylori UM077]EPZ97867.1 hypothetical protein N204_04925 [Helicobacter pylori UM085]